MKMCIMSRAMQHAKSRIFMHAYFEKQNQGIDDLWHFLILLAIVLGGFMGLGSAQVCRLAECMCNVMYHVSRLPECM